MVKIGIVGCAPAEGALKPGGGFRNVRGNQEGLLEEVILKVGLKECG